MATSEDLQAITYQESHLADDVSYQIIISGAVCTVAAVVAVLLRLYARHLTKGGLGKDDYMMLFALVIYIVYEVLVAITTNFGEGRHFITLGSSDLYNLKVYTLVTECLDNLLIAAAETSVLLLYHRIFKHQKGFRISLWIVGSWIWATKIAFILATVFQCNPISYAWNQEGSAYCIDINEMSMVAAVFNVVTNLGVLLMPVPMLWSLNIEKKRRIQLIFAFTIGALTCVTSGVRINYTSGLASFDAPSDISWRAVPLTVACTIEGCLFVVSGCIPTYRILITHKTLKSKSEQSEKNNHTRTTSKRSLSYRVVSVYEPSEKNSKANSINDPLEGGIEVTKEFEVTSEPEGKYETKI